MLRHTMRMTSGESDAAHYDVAIIGGGAAGLFCAALTAAGGRSVIVLEHANRVGKKILMSGGGRCNFTNLDVRPTHYRSANPHFCKSALARFAPADFIARVERHGIAYHEKERGQLFCDESSKLIVRMLLDDCAEAGVRIEVDCSVGRVRAREPGQRSGFALSTTCGPLRCDALVVATGGLSIPSMGATGFGYELARQFGHHVLPTRAGLVPLTLSGAPSADYEGLAGLAVPSAVEAGGLRFDGGLLFTHRGLSGPPILQISSYWSPGEALMLDLLPGGDAAHWLLSQQKEKPNAELRTVLAERLTKRLAHRLCERWLGSKPLRQYRVAELQALGAQLQTWSVTPNGTEGYRTAEVTEGGVDTDAVSSATLESRLQKGLYFLGEVLDVSGQLGGYNFQWAWASAHAVAQALTRA